MEPAFQTRFNDLQSTAAKSLSQANAMPKGIYRGARSPLGSSGPLSRLERGNHAFTRYRARHICSAPARRRT